MSHPYSRLPDRNFWRSAVAERNPLEWRDLYAPKFEITRSMRIVSAGSCFAQHIGRQLLRSGFHYQQHEKPPGILAPEDHARFGYGLFSTRSGNVYTARQLLQLYRRATGAFRPAEDVVLWEGRAYDPFRPSVEPGGFASAEELRHIRDTVHFPAVRRMFLQAELLVFTLGLTEAWVSKEDGAVHPTCPGTICGRFDSARHGFHNFTFAEVMRDMEELLAALRQRNPALKVLLTVSPVPLTATAEDAHVLVATTHSKSVLRAVAGELSAAHDFVDYFPSYEIVTAPAMRGAFFQPNLREVSAAGVELVLRHFFAAHGGEAPATPPPETPASTRTRPDDSPEGDIICDEAKLELVRF
ncbi:GSCFA family protein [Roseomonas rosea]|uniref:GSCFA family protein n=1 Tax=Muricoccus roseus TaxID=198092 RepID=A0A1M6G7U9_9PROT|nr:GSCFA domain-containing protein [Roseomonas rosea]SHJ05998.1 GSCFA family protein [Roseomonas rosea]